MAMHSFPPLQTNTSQLTTTLLSVRHHPFTPNPNPNRNIVTSTRPTPTRPLLLCRNLSPQQPSGNVTSDDDDDDDDDQDNYNPNNNNNNITKTKMKKKKKNKNKFKKTMPTAETKVEENLSTAAAAVATDSQKSVTDSVMKRLDDVNPVGLGRRSRQMFDEVWRKFSGLGQISRTTLANDDASIIGESGPLCEFAIPGAQNTTVLVIGATSRVGRIVVRKLMLRGYTVKALVRKPSEEVVNMLPTSVGIVMGDVGDFSSLKPAVEGCNKIIYCATARSSITGDLNRVDNQGVCNVAKAFQDYNNELAQLRAGKSSKSKLLIAKFKSAESLHGWEVRQGTYFEDVVASKYDGGMDAKFEFTENGEAIFSGYVFTRGGYIELSKKISLPLGSTLDRYEGLVLSVGGNGRSYVLILETGSSADASKSNMYFARISTKVGFCRVRVPFSTFRPVKPNDPPLDPFLVHTLTIRFEPRRQRPIEGPAGVKQDLRSFKLIMEYVKALPTGQETDFVLVSCTGSGIEPNRREQVLRAKKAGEDSLRKSGLGYTIVRPGPLMEEPGGQRALIFDQGNRISQGISCADVAISVSKHCMTQLPGTRALMSVTSMWLSLANNSTNWLHIYRIKQITI
ncbi:OLC1v1033469C1 [Oldenlandia corymbosa var. corymbosa]|uniref:OLC1v1033469C1 n=1 Tax=Oldenlandia corymbosa var. corymbosa TaxID=529605 RepID=A0AAV1CPM8_OLDCO|nr:OLC1v1033469C1 [Oldenlandia corymbosa var. corymbosa]